MAGPTVTLTPANPTPGSTVTAAVVRDIPAATVAVNVTEANGATGSGSVKVVEPLTVTDASSVAHTWTAVSDDGTTATFTTTV